MSRTSSAASKTPSSRTRTSTKQSHANGFSNWFGLLSGPRDVIIPRIVLIGSVFILTVFGLVMVFSSSNVIAMDEGTSPTSYLTRQVLALIIALICGAIMAAIPYSKWLGRALDWLFALAFALLLLTAVIGTAGLGAQRWLVIGPVNFQPSEFVKVVIILVAARILYDWRTLDISTLRIVIEFAVGIVVPLFFILRLQSDFGTTVICCVGLLVVAWVDNLDRKVFFVLIGLAVIVALVAIFGTSYRADRIAGLFGGNSDASYQADAAMHAFANGGLFGVGIGNSTMKYGTLPEAHTDFIFAIVGEECGLIGALAIVLLFCALGWAGIRIARQAPDSFGAMIAAGCTVMLVVQAFINIACVLGIFPVTGKPLPFMSSGGSALIGSYIVVGTILSVSLNSGNNSSIYDQRRRNLRVITNSSRPNTFSSASSTQKRTRPTFRDTRDDISFSRGRTRRSDVFEYRRNRDVAPRRRR